MSGVTVARALLEAAQALGTESARAEAEMLMSRALGQPRSWLYAHSDAVLGAIQLKNLHDLLDRRRRGEPVALILGTREFWSMELVVTSDTLIPRPETELLVELALQHLPAEATSRALDLGTGTGAIALALAHERPQAVITAIDSHARTLAVAQKNAARLGLDRVRFLLGNWFSAVRDESFDVIVSNPPYIGEDDPHLLQGDLPFEPRAALASGPDGLDAIRAIVAQAPAHLSPGGWLLLEHGSDQGDAVRGLLASARFTSVTTHQDLEDRDRVTVGRIEG